MIINLENNQVAFSIENSQSAKLLINSKIENSAPLGIPFFESYLEQASLEQIMFCLSILGQKTTLLEVGEYRLLFKNSLNFRHILHSSKINQVAFRDALRF